eukprot:TRINITY_DN16835_c0_g1_i1.p1 TRINITY_DN16835_c0_g1~~TRINITY_DN16835_c0_g1_i1.p1  ORF type:complete len:809 (-),score=101.93 TRINITY_DN16835_c0_g1_i1:135-2516(-)
MPSRPSNGGASHGGASRGGNGAGEGHDVRFSGDGLGNFSVVNQEESVSREAPPQAVDYTELEHDPSERKPGGPLVEAIRALGPQAWQQKWMVPGVAFLCALVLESMVQHMATHRYVLMMTELEDRYPPRQGLASIADSLGPRDRFARWWGPRRAGLLLNLIFGVLPFVWAFIVGKHKMLRLWTRTLFVATGLVLVHATLAWVTVVPDPAGWEQCRSNLYPWVLDHFEEEGVGGLTGFFKSAFQVTLLFAQNVLTGMRYESHFVCSKGMSGASYLCAVSALGLFEATRIGTRKMKPHFRSWQHLLVASALSTLVLMEALFAISSGRQFTSQVILSVAFAALMYGSPVPAIVTNLWLTRGCEQALADTRLGPKEIGDVVVPPCCFPFCWLHGRYFLFEVESAAQRREREESKQRSMDEAMRVSQQYRAEQEDADRKFAELQAHREKLRRDLRQREEQRIKEHERRVRDEVEKAYQKTLEERAERERAERIAEEAKAKAKADAEAKAAEIATAAAVASSGGVQSLQSPNAAAHVDLPTLPGDTWASMHSKFGSGTPLPKEAASKSISGLAGSVAPSGAIPAEGASDITSVASLPSDAWEKIHMLFPAPKQSARTTEPHFHQPSTVPAEGASDVTSVASLPADAWEKIHTRFPAPQQLQRQIAPPSQAQADTTPLASSSFGETHRPAHQHHPSVGSWMTKRPRSQPAPLVTRTDSDATASESVAGSDASRPAHHHHPSVGSWMTKRPRSQPAQPVDQIQPDTTETESIGSIDTVRSHHHHPSVGSWMVRRPRSLRQS